MIVNSIESEISASIFNMDHAILLILKHNRKESTDNWPNDRFQSSVNLCKEVLICFDHETDGYNQCHSFDGVVFRRETNSTYPHRSAIGFASYKGQPFTTGSLNPRNLKTEIMDTTTKEWRDAASYPFATSTLWVPPFWRGYTKYELKSSRICCSEHGWCSVYFGRVWSSSMGTDSKIQRFDLEKNWRIDSREICSWCNHKWNGSHHDYWWIVER